MMHKPNPIIALLYIQLWFKKLVEKSSQERNLETLNRLQGSFRIAFCKFHGFWPTSLQTALEAWH
jgi:hypothetical protein